MASEHNPFRRKTASTSFSSTPQPVSTSAFLESITSGISKDNVPEGRPAKAKVVKRVRVLSPPPSSPSSPESVNSRGFGRQDDSSDDASDDEDDQFSKRFPELPDGLDEAAPLRLANADPTITPDNPFGKKLQDVGGLDAGNASSGGQGKSLDVNAFKMLLLTGKSGAASQGGNAAGAAHAAGSDAFNPADPDTPCSSSDIADRGITLASPPSRRKPPPPSSRHGRKISIQTPERPHISSENASPISPSDVNKPLPPAPSSHGGDGTEDVFAREAAGKVPEQDPPTPGLTPVQPASGKKPTPAPPPRRGHARSQSLTASAGANAPSMTGSEADTPPRSSLESQRSRSESFKSINAPAPPPPRRPHASHRQSFQLASPSTASFNAASPAPSDVENPASEITPPKISPPPPPPARNTSTRRPPSVRSFDATSRKASGGKENAPPPPPPRQRGSSRGSMDGFAGARRPSIDSTRGFSTNVPEEPGEDGSQGYADPGKGADILADLDALQREVDALRAQQPK
ncbi:hypothetical protein CkaCkLH20_11816 [Colletotrichum karsti]|uniref:Uncharacterized protein n=1 Tax=Colletotrichum karsti TaxID=1095194 RepID=A0A9P6HUS2_9PEZI|nr:uncharacterized protein CkaCkLH20_11816 [Colletotrichum karsti]KAF9870714.1 hypothetical protein CkaCkLH20_11816 [Colletotrichum karsti]